MLTTKAQNTVKTDTIDVAKIKTAIKIKNNTYWKLDGGTSFSPKQLLSINFTDTIPESLPPPVIDKAVYLKFAVKNSSDTTIKVFFHPGYYYREIRLFKYDPTKNTVSEIIDTAAVKGQKAYREIPVEGNTTNIIFSKLKFLKTVDNLNPRLVNKDFLPSLINNFRFGDKDIHTFTFIFCGILLMMIFYSLAVFSMNRNLEFLYYSGYAFIMVVMFFFKSYLYKTPTPFNYFFEAYLDFVIHSMGIYVYIAFIRKFIDAKNNFPVLDKLFTVDQILIMISLVLYTYFHYIKDDYVSQYFVENATKFLWTLFTMVFIAYAIYTRRRLLYYLAAGHFFLFCFGLVSMYLIVSGKNFGSMVPPLLNSSIFYYEVGLAIELIFFLIALAFKNRKDLIERIQERERLKLKTERQELEKQMAVLSAMQEERNRISADMHDELGSGVTAIRLMSELVKAKMKGQTLPEIERISSSANDLINKMNTIIWTMKSENDSLESLIAYIRAYASEFFESTNIDCSVLIPERIPNVVLTGEKRRNIFLCVKESLNNVVKHSRATRVNVRFEFGKQLTIIISDDGVGIDMEKLRVFGNGLGNMRKRMENIDGAFHIENDSGAKSLLVVPF